jgi:replicative superfamily II helicase
MMSIKPNPTDADLLRMISSANEFENLRVRQEEQSELDDLQAKCPLQMEGPVNDAATKTFVLLQAFISRQRPKGFTLISDTNYIASNASRVARAIFEMCLHDDKKDGNAGTALKLLRFAKTIDNQFWWFQTPLRHFESELGVQIIKSMESRHHNGGKGDQYDTLVTTLSLLDMTTEEGKSKALFLYLCIGVIIYMPQPNNLLLIFLSLSYFHYDGSWTAMCIQKTYRRQSPKIYWYDS